MSYPVLSGEVAQKQRECLEKTCRCSEGKDTRELVRAASGA